MRDEKSPRDIAGLPPGWSAYLHTTSNANAEIERELVAEHPHHGRVAVWVGRRGIVDATIVALRNRIADKTPRISVIYLDVDEVLVDWVGDALYVLGYDAAAVMREWSAMNPRPWNLFDVLGVEPSVMWSYIDNHGAEFWARLRKLPWADDLLATCREFTPTVLVTSPAQSPVSHAGKAQWMAETFGADFNDYALTRAKYRFAHSGALLIDDSPKNCALFRQPPDDQPGGHAILFPGVGNDLHYIPGDARVAYVREQLKGYRR